MDCPHGNKPKTCFWCSELPIEAGAKGSYERGYKDGLMAVGIALFDGELEDKLSFDQHVEIDALLGRLGEKIPRDDGVVPTAVYNLKQREVDLYKTRYEEARRVLNEFLDHVTDMGWEDADSDSEGMEEIRKVLYPERELWADTKNDKPA